MERERTCGNLGRWKTVWQVYVLIRCRLKNKQQRWTRGVRRRRACDKGSRSPEPVAPAEMDDSSCSARKRTFGMHPRSVTCHSGQVEAGARVDRVYRGRMSALMPPARTR